ncbi:aromatic ring-hydroxylating dioxygenase subunit alpha [Seonamhaeicola sp. MEBiC1930]|uniref:aromatic ring-hydroxylating oxygenase subunit alpha n=1 Tax=Seonamhaeicola sp. MEBiC01930 TaxID=2976768 RepID=UPI00324A9411
MTKKYIIDSDIRKAETLPANFYKDENTFEAIKSNVFLKSWQFIGDESLLEERLSVHPFSLLENYLSEPLLLTKDDDNKIHCLSNVCTHRGNLVVLKSGKSKKLTCGYHGRRFNLKGKFEYMPEFKRVIDFPKPCDNLHELPLLKWGSLLFVGLNPLFNFQQVIDKMNERIGFLPFDKFVLTESLNKDFIVKAHWALYCDNFLEGFHVPFVHKDLDAVLDYGSYKTETYQYCNLQIGYTDEPKNTFDLPENHMDYGKHVAAYYYWVFPNMMFNFYPWGLSLNIIQPLTRDKTKVSFISYVLDASKLEKGAGSGLEKVEKEDEAIVENVQKGVNSSFYKSGRYSPNREQGVHHFHSLLTRFLNM